MTNTHKRDWGKIISDYRSSGDSVSDFCRQRRISASSLYHWLARDIDRKDEVKFLPALHKTSPEADFAELIFPNGVLRFSKGASPAYVSSIVKSLV